MIYSFDDLAVKYKDYTDIKGKISRDVKNNRLIPIVRGVYESDKNTPGKYLAGRIFGPSYLSFDYALAQYGLIPEAIYNTYTSATFQKKKTKTYHNAFGDFLYRDIPSDAYPFGIKLIEENGYSYQIATPEKAICDKLYSISPVKNLKELQELLFNDLRIDETEFWELNLKDMEYLSRLYRSTNLNLLIKMIRRQK